MDDIVDIENLAFGGFGVGTSHGKKVFIPYVIPGERVAFRVVRSQKRLDWGRLVDVVEPSPLRRAAPCPYFGDCGGCQWQHIDDPAQVRYKQKLFEDTLSRLGNIDPDRVRPIIKAPHPFHYRRRITLHGRGGALGFYATRSNRVVRVEKCLIADPSINQILPALSDLAPRLDAVQMEVAASLHGQEIMIHIQSERTLSRAQRESLLCSVEALSGVRVALIEDPGGAADLKTARGLRFSLPASTGEGSSLDLEFTPGVFFQVNWEQNIRLLDLLLTAVKGMGSELNALELHSGAGNFTVPMAALGHRVCSVEQNKRAVADARLNIERNNITGVESLVGDTAEILKKLADEGKRFDLIITDPPRGGVKGEMESLLRLKAPHLLYVSCDPATLARDIRSLERGGYRLVGAQPLDFFPQTYHIESLNHLELR